MASAGSDQIRICDFGNAMKLDSSEEYYCKYGTPEYVAPEIVNQTPVSTATDIWWATCSPAWRSDYTLQAPASLSAIVIKSLVFYELPCRFHVSFICPALPQAHRCHHLPLVCHIHFCFFPKTCIFRGPNFNVTQSIMFYFTSAWLVCRLSLARTTEPQP